MKSKKRKGMELFYDKRSGILKEVPNIYQIRASVLAKGVD